MQGVAVEFGLLGPLELVREGRVVSAGGTREREVLALLLLSPNRVVSAERLIEDLWAGRPPAGALRALRVFVSRLRRALREAGAEDILQTRPPGYLVKVDPLALDVARFEAGVAAARAAAAAGDMADAADTYARALALWRGPALADVCGAPVARAEAARLEEVRLGALEERLEADLACGRHARLIAELEGLTRAHPLREGLWKARMVALYRAGRQADALRAYAEVRTLLAEELGLDPGGELVRLETAVLRQDPSLDWRALATLAPPTIPAPPHSSPPPLREDSLHEAGRFGEGPVTILFTDVEGSTDLRTRHGDHEAQRLLSAHEAIVRAQIGAHQGREVKALGDGFMVAFASARRAVTCAVAIQRALAGPPGEPPALFVRIGLNTGEVLHEGEELYGQAVHAAARIAGRAEGGQILVSELVRQLVGAASGVTFVDRGRHRLKGFAERWRLFEVSWDDGTLPWFAARTPYVGRTAEQEELGRLLGQVIAGRGALAMVSGEAGVGKTRLTQELAAEAARRGVWTRVGRCYETAGAPPYVPFVELFEQALDSSPSPHAFRDLLGEHAPEIARLLPRLRRLFPDLPPPLELPAEQERRYLFASVRDVLARATASAPVVFVLDDLHWADEPTLLLLEHLTERIAELPILLVGTYRDNEVDARPALARTLDRLIRRSLITRIPLRRLGSADVGTLLRALSGREPPPPLVKLIHAQTDGNPFFVEEVYKHLAEEGRLFDDDGRFRAGVAGELDVPETLRLVLGRRLEHLTPVTLRILEGAAVLGRAFTYELLEAMGGVAPDELLDCLDEAERARLVVPLSADPQESRLLFAHELIRQTILAGLSRPRRQRLHLAAARALKELYGPTPDPQASEVAEHLTKAGTAADKAELLRYLSLAGRHAMAAAAFEEALRHFEHALTLRQVTDPTEQVQLLVDVALARRSLGQLQEAHAIWLAAIDGYQALGDVEALARTCAEAAENLIWCNRDQEGFDLAMRGLTALEDAAPPLRARMLGWAAGTGAWVASYEIVDAMSREAIALGESLGDPQLLGEILMNDTSLRVAFDQQQQAAESGLRATELLAVAGDPWNMAQAYGWRQVALVELGRFDDLAAARASFLDVAARLGNFAAVWCDNWAEAARSAAVCGLEAYEANARAGQTLSVGLNFESIVLPRLGMAAFFRGQWDAAVELCRDGARHELTNRLRGIAFGPLLQVLAYSNDRAGALEILAAETATMPMAGVPNACGSWILLGHAVEALAVLGEREACAALYPVAAELVATGVVLTVFQGRLTHRTAGIAAAADRNWAAAEEHFTAALRQADELPHLLEYAETRRFYAQMLLDRAAPGDRDRASTFLAEAEARYTRLGLPRHVHLVQQLATGTSTPHT